MDPINIIQKYYAKDSLAYKILVEHVEAVTKKAVEVALRVPQLNPDVQFIREAGMLHDIGIIMTDSPKFGCFGEKPYVSHGYLGRELLEKEGYPKHAVVCERHMGISVEDIQKRKLPIPKRDMLPVTIEDEIISFADKFFSKDQEELSKEKRVGRIRAELPKFGEGKLKIFDDWMEKFGEE